VLVITWYMCRLNLGLVHVMRIRVWSWIKFAGTACNVGASTPSLRSYHRRIFVCATVPDIGEEWSVHGNDLRIFIPVSIPAQAGNAVSEHGLLFFSRHWIFTPVSIPARAGSAVSKRGLLFFFRHCIGWKCGFQARAIVFLSTLKSIIVISTMFLARIIVTDHIRYEIFQRHPTIAGRNLPANSLVET